MCHSLADRSIVGASAGVAFAAAAGASVVEEASAAEAAFLGEEAFVAAAPVLAHKPAPALRRPPPLNPAPHAQTRPTQYQTETSHVAAAAVQEGPYSTADVEAAEEGALAAVVVAAGAYQDAVAGRSDSRSFLALAAPVAAVAQGSDSSSSQYPQTLLVQDWANAQAAVHPERPYDFPAYSASSHSAKPVHTVIRHLPPANHACSGHEVA